MSDTSRLVLEVDSKGVATANGNLDLFKKKASEAAGAADKIKKSTKDTSDGMGGLSSQLGMATIAWGSVVAAEYNFMKASVEASGQMEMLKTNLQVVTGSAAEADTIFRKLNQFASETPFSVAGITDTATQLMQVGVSAQDLMGQLQMLGDVSGGSQEKLNRIMMNYTQILSVGKASTMDIRQFAQANLPIYQELEKVTGKTGEALQDMITSGEITGEVITKAFQDMTAEGGKFYNGMNLLADTYQGKLSTTKDSINNLASAFGNLWLLPAAKALLGGTTSVTGGLASWLTNIEDGKTAFDTFDNNYASSTYQQREYVANKQIEYWQKRRDLLKRVGGDYQEDPEWQEAKKQYDAWDDYLTKITKEEAVLEKTQRESADAALEASKNGKAAAAEAAKWQEILKKTLDLDALPKSGVQAVADYQKNLEDSLHGDIAYAQMTGGSVLEVYRDYAEKVRKAMNELLVSGQFSPTDNAITGLNDLQRSMSVDFGISKTSLFDDPLFDTSSAEKNITRLNGLFDDLNEKINTARENGDWSEYFKNYSIQAGVSSIQGTDAGNFVQGFSQGGWQNGLINMVVGAFMKDLEDIESFQRALNLVSEALKPAAEMIGEFTDALSPLMDAAVIGGELGQELAEVTLMIEPLLPTIKILSAGIYYASKLIMWGVEDLEKAFNWLTGGIFEDLGDFADSLTESTEAIDEQTAATLEVVEQLKKIRDQIKEDQQYYLNQLQTQNAAQVVSSYSSASVNDAIIAPGGRIISTAPDDYLIATKTPQALGGSGRMQLNVSINNTVSDSVTALVTTQENADGTKELLVQITKKFANDIATGALDDALRYREARLSGRRVSV